MEQNCMVFTFLFLNFTILKMEYRMKANDAKSLYNIDIKVTKEQLIFTDQSVDIWKVKKKFIHLLS